MVPDQLHAMKGSLMAIFSGELSPQALLYHYTSPTTLPKILGSKLIRLSPLADMADARESRTWNLSVRDDVNSGVTNTEFQSWRCGIDEVLRQRAKVACFTGDRLPTGPAGSADQFHRGYARARMWDQYACHHTGACLIFDEIALVEQATRTLGVHSEVQFDRVSYVDRRVGDAYGSLSFKVSDLRRGVADAAEQYLSSNWKELLLTKNLDWASEEERRILFLEPDSVATIREFPFGSALVAVVLGESFEHDVQAKAVSLAEAAGLPSEKVAQCIWFGGSPQVLPLS